MLPLVRTRADDNQVHRLYDLLQSDTGQEVDLTHSSETPGPTSPGSTPAAGLAALSLSLHLYSGASGPRDLLEVCCRPWSNLLASQFSWTNSRRPRTPDWGRRGCGCGRCPGAQIALSLSPPVSSNVTWNRGVALDPVALTFFWELL